MRTLLVIIILNILLVDLWAQPKIELSAELLEKLKAIALQDVPPNAPGIATAIIHDGVTKFEQYAGFADLADSTLINEKSRFNIASNGKQYTALAILILESQGKLSLQDDLRKYLPTLYPDVKSKITIESLINHSSGIRDVYDLWSVQGLTWWKQTFSNDDVLTLIGRQRELNFTPGTQHRYSNTNYILLALIVEKVSGQSFIVFTNSMFAALGMHSTSFESDYTKIKGPIANAYFNFNTWTNYDWKWNVTGDGNIFSTLPDLIRWEKVVSGDIKTKVNRRIILKSQQLTSNPNVTNYGYGLDFGKYKGLPYQSHAGATGAWKAFVVRFPESKHSFLTVTNSGKAIPSQQTWQMVDAAFNLKSDSNYFLTKPSVVGPLFLEDELTGIYLSGGSFYFEFIQHEEGFFLRRQGRGDVKLERESANIFRQVFDPDFKQEFRKNASGEMEVTAYYTSHAPYTLIRKNIDWSAIDYGFLNGQYISRELEVKLELEHVGGTEYRVRINNRNTKGILVSDRKLLVDSYLIQFNADENQVKELYLNGERIMHVRFTKQ